MDISNHSKYSCKLCNKTYTNRQNLWRHNKMDHVLKDSYKNSSNDNNEHKVPPKDVIMSSCNQKNPSKSTTIKSKQITKNICEFCNYEFARSDTLKKHLNRCRIKKSDFNLLKEKNDLLEKQLKQQSEEMLKMKQMLSEIINKKGKVHPKTLNKINKQLTGDYNTINDLTNNGIINNTYVLALGHENLPEIFTKKEKINVLKNKFNCLPYLVEYTHFNDKYPQFKNILITNTQNNLAYKFDNKIKQFKAVDKNELLEDIVNERMYDINSFYDELEEKLDEKTKDIIEKVKSKIDNDPEYREIKKKDIKLIIYNNRKKVPKDIIYGSESDDSDIEV